MLEPGSTILLLYTTISICRSLLCLVHYIEHFPQRSRSSGSSAASSPLRPPALGMSTRITPHPPPRCQSRQRALQQLTREHGLDGVGLSSKSHISASRQRTQTFPSSSVKHSGHLLGHSHDSVRLHKANSLFSRHPCHALTFFCPNRSGAAEKGVEKQVDLQGASDAAEVEKRIASLLQ